MQRLPPLPDLEWRDDGAPVSRTSDDVYFSADDGLAETRTVFLNGCGLPDAWAGREQFTVAELGFGTGLNFLALWELWAATRPSPSARLNFVSFEGTPLDREQAQRAHSKWPDLKVYADKLIDRWPDRARGVRQIEWPDAGLRLTLHIDDISVALPDARFSADAWFLDGFSPAKNPDMWDPALYPRLAERSASRARLGTYTVAGHVRRGLTEAGFTVEKQPGHGRKRERLAAEFVGTPAKPADIYGLRGPDLPPKRVAILGAGIAGATAARALVSHGVETHLFDPAPAPASAASGNALALLMPRLDAGDTAQARLLIDAYLLARATYRALPGVSETDVRQTPRSDDERARFAKVFADPPLPLEDLEALAGGGLLHKRALILRPSLLIESLLEGANLHLGQVRHIDRDDFDAVILANGMAANTALPWLGLEARLGQVEHLANASDAPPSAIAAGHYALADGTDRLWGATFERHDGDPIVKADAVETNAQALSRLQPWWRAQVKENAPESRAGIRATTPDRLPVIGAAPDHDAMRSIFTGYEKGRPVASDAPLVDGLYVSTGFGSRGFTWGPWAASILTSQLFSSPAPAPNSALKAVSPARLILRTLRRGR